MAMFKQKQRLRGQDPTGFEHLAAVEAPSEAEASDHSAGGLLRSTREELGWQLPDVAAALRIRAGFLEALERNTTEGLPGPTYATGFLRAYAEYLGLDGHEIVRRFRAEKIGLHTKPELAFPVPLTDRGIPGGSIVLIVLLIVGLAYVAFYYLSSPPHATQAPTVEPVPARLLPPPPSPPPIALVEPPKPTEPAAAAPPSVPPAAPPPPTVPASGTADAEPGASAAHSYGDPAPGRVVIRATGKAWVTVKEGEKPILNTLFNKGDTFNTPDRKGLTLKTGSAGALEFIVDGKALAPLGPIGQIRTLPLDPDKLQSLAPPG
jgi:cytoskeleton protein RodZ